MNKTGNHLRKHKTAKQAMNELHMSADYNGWFDGDKFIPFSQMTEEHLQRAKIHAQRKELFYTNRAQIFSLLVDKIDEEAEKRGKTLRDHDTQFHKNTRVLKQAMAQS